MMTTTVEVLVLVVVTVESLSISTIVGMEKESFFTCTSTKNDTLLLLLRVLASRE